MKKIGSALALILLLSACKPGPDISEWDTTLNPWMTSAGWSVERFESENFYVIRKNGVDMWRRAIYCGRGCMGENFLLPDELRYAAEVEFIADREAAQAAYLALLAEKIGITPIPRPEEPAE